MKNWAWLCVVAGLGSACTGRSHSLGGNDAGATGRGGESSAGGAGGKTGQDAGAEGGDTAGGHSNVGGAGSGAPGGSGGVENAGGTCSAGGVFGFAGAGGAQTTLPPTCPLDAQGYAMASLGALCEIYRCTATPAELLRGVECTESSTGAGRITRTVGCGRETVRIGTPGRDPWYLASFDSVSGELLGLETGATARIGLQPCRWDRHRAGSLPGECAEEVRYVCLRPDPVADEYVGCRAPDEPGCGSCCSATDDGCSVSYATEPGASVYGSSTSSAGACPCGCKPCAECTLEEELVARAAFERKECDCSIFPQGAGGARPDQEPCGSYCGSIGWYTAQCPGIR